MAKRILLHTVCLCYERHIPLSEHYLSRQEERHPMQLVKNTHAYSFLFVILYFITPPAALPLELSWTEQSLIKMILKAEKAASKKNWAQAIKYGEKALKGSAQLNKENDIQHINHLNNLNHYYDKVNQLDEIAGRVKKTYVLSKKHLSASNETTRKSRLLYYRYLLSKKKYHQAIPLAIETLSTTTESDRYRYLHYLKQLYSLYGITGQLEKEAEALKIYIEKNERIFGRDEDTMRTVLILGQNYCRQEKRTLAKELMSLYDLKYDCP